MLTPTAQELWRLDSPDRFTALAVEGVDVTCIYDGPSQADAQAVAAFWKRSHDGVVSIVGGEWAA